MSARDSAKRSTKDRRASDAPPDRRGNPPLPYSSELARFTCICQRPHQASDTIVECACGRRWVKR